MFGKFGTSLTQIYEFLKDTVTSPAFYSAKTEPSLVLTNVLQSVSGYISFSTPLNISENSGVITFSKSGKYKVDIERAYTNRDTNPLPPINLVIEIWKNGVKAFDREGIIGSATSPNEPARLTATSPSILDIEADDYFEIKVLATEGTGSPSDCTLDVLQIAIHKVGNS